MMNTETQPLEVSTETLRATLCSAREAIIIVDDRAQLIFANDSTQQLFGYAAQELIGEPVTRLIPAHLWQHYTQAFEAAAGGTAGRTCELMARHKNGQSIPVEISLSMWERDERRFFSGIVRDSSGRRDTERRLRQSRENLDTILNSMDAVVYIADMRTHELLFLNEHGKHLFGDIVGKTCWNTLQQGQSGPCNFCTNDQLLDDDGEPTTGVVWEFQNTINDRWYQCRDRAIRWFDGRLVRMEIATDITKHKQLEHQLLELAGNDPLVGLANRTLLLDRLEQAIKLAHRRQDSLAVLFIDLDGFKSINDEHGHRIGDLCLIEIAQRLHACMRESDTVARYGGDEFVVLLQNEVRPDAVGDIARKLIDAASVPLQVGDVQVQISASIGVALYPEHGSIPDQLIRYADRAMYQAKQRHGGHYQIAPSNGRS